jgi:hypothetical protein
MLLFYAISFSVFSFLLTKRRIYKLFLQGLGIVEAVAVFVF